MHHCVSSHMQPDTGFRNNIAAAKLAGLQQELGLDSFQYETAVSVLFFGYLLMQVPSNLLLNKIGKPALYLPSCVSHARRGRSRCLQITNYCMSPSSR